MKKQFDPKKTIFVIDGSTFLYRAYYSMRPLNTSKGVAVQAVYVFCKMIKKLINTFNPELMTIAWDSKGPTERSEIYIGYKTGRQSPPSDLFVQKELIIQFANLIGLSQLEKSGVEADDIINSVVQDYKNKGYEIVVVASDKDLQQVIDQNVFVYDYFKEELIDANAFEEKMGFTVDKLPFYFSLLGDTSDNIPGVKGIGKTGATDLVKNFKSLDDLYNNIDKVTKERTKNALLENKEDAFLSYELFKLRYHEMDIPQAKLAFDSNNWINAEPLFAELEFKSFLADTQKLHEKKIEQKPFFADEKGYKFKCVTTQKDLNELANYLIEKKSFAIDTETDGISVHSCKLIGISVCAEKGLAFYIPFGHKTDQPQLTFEEVSHALKPILENEKYEKYLHHAKFDKLILYNYGINLQGVTFDSLIAASLVLEDGVRIGLKFLSNYFFEERMLTYEEVVKDKKLKDFSYANLTDATNYAAGDAHQTFVLKSFLEQKLKDMGLEKVYKDIEMPLSEILFEMEINGVNLDFDILKKIGVQLDKDIKTIENQIQVICELSEPINLNSPKQVENLLFNILKLQPLKKSAKKTGFSTDHKVLEELSQVHIVPQLMLKHREFSKLKNTYIDALPEYINPKTNKIHTTFSQTTTSTGRLSSYYPNLQNIPTNGFGVRSSFIPGEGQVFISADYSQIELRILAYFSQDQNLIDAFLKGEDIHTKTASLLLDVPVEEVTQQQRQIGKRINFSILYGLTPFGLSKDLKIPFNEAKTYIEKYFQQYPGVSQWMDKIVNFAKEKGYVETLFGRRRYVPGIYEKNKTLYDLARRIAINTPAQGTAADIMKLGMIRLSKAFEEKKLNSQILIQIHDELLITAEKGKESEIEKITKDVLESVVEWNIPLIVTTRFGDNWQEVTK